MRRLWSSIVMSLAAAACALALGACGPDTPDLRFDCTCTVSCGVEPSTRVVTLCEAESTEDEVKSDAVAQCEKESCGAKSCSCSCTRNGDCN